jgi:hypothetical protein
VLDSLGTHMFMGVRIVRIEVRDREMMVMTAQIQIISGGHGTGIFYRNTARRRSYCSRVRQCCFSQRTHRINVSKPGKIHMCAMLYLGSLVQRRIHIPPPSEHDGESWTIMRLSDR